MLTKKQKQREERHRKIRELYEQLTELGGSREAVWETLEKKTGYSRQWLRKIVKQPNI